MMYITFVEQKIKDAVEVQLATSHHANPRWYGKQNRAKQSKAKQSRARQSKAKQSKAKQSEGKQSKAKQSKAKQSKAKQKKGTEKRKEMKIIKRRQRRREDTVNIERAKESKKYGRMLRLRRG